MNRIKKLRMQNNITQLQLCKILNIAQPTLSGYETDNFQPDNAILIQIADYFNETIDYVLGREEARNRLREIRQLKGRTTHEIAELLSIEEQTYINIENEFLPIKEEYINKLCKFYSVEKDFLTGKKYKLGKPINQWRIDLQDDYEKAKGFEKVYLECKYGNPIYIETTQNNKKEKHPLLEITEEEKEWLEMYRTLNNEQKQFYLAIAKMNEDEIYKLNKLVDVVIEKKRNN